MCARPTRPKPYEVPEHIKKKLVMLKDVDRNKFDENLQKLEDDAHRNGVLYNLADELKAYDINDRVYFPPHKIPLNTTGRLYEIKHELEVMKVGNASPESSFASA